MPCRNSKHSRCWMLAVFIIVLVVFALYDRYIAAYVVVLLHSSDFIIKNDYKKMRIFSLYSF